MKTSKYTDITTQKHLGVLAGSVETHNCPTEERCWSCGGNGRCTSCAGRGEERCWACGGKGELKCSHCYGGGVCQVCHGKGGGVSILTGKWEDCSSCNGGGYCSFCHGRGASDCHYCTNGFNFCAICNGTGNCSYCFGSGVIECSKCNGTGCYQTFLSYEGHLCVRQYVYPGSTKELTDGLRLAEGTELCNFVAKYWQKEGVLAFDNTERCFDKVKGVSAPYGDLAEKFEREYASIPEMTSKISGYAPYMNVVRANKIPCTRIKYVINGQEYEMVFMGTNGVVCYDAVPSSIKILERSAAEKADLKETAYSRHQALAALTAYIINLRGADVSKSVHLRLILKHMCLNAIERDRMVKFLKQRYTPEISAEIMLGKVKCLFTNKKTICYAWQQMSYGKKISPAEQAFFNKLAARFAISKGEINSLKRVAAGYSELENKNFVKEYLESPAVYRDPNYRFWKFIIPLLFGATSFLGTATINNLKWAFALVPSLIVFIIVFAKHNPYSQPKQKGIGTIYARVYKQAELTAAYYKKAPILLRLWYKIVDIQISFAAKLGLFFDKIRSCLN